MRASANLTAMRKVLVSACLLGERVRYHGGDAAIEHPTLERWRREGRIVTTCPEMEGGLPTPRPPAEMQDGSGTAVLKRVAFVRRRDGVDVTDAFVRGARFAVDLARAHEIGIAVLKDFSPSCGSTTVYDGTFSGRRAPGEGVTAAALREAGVRVFSDAAIDAADALLRAEESE
jgi:uncharacterized protein YbbK (DUF523 family)